MEWCALENEARNWDLSCVGWMLFLFHRLPQPISSPSPPVSKLDHHSVSYILDFCPPFGGQMRSWGEEVMTSTFLGADVWMVLGEDLGLGSALNE